MTPYYLVQSDLVWESPEANRRQLGDMMAECRNGIVILPEMFATGFSMNSKRLAETMSGPTVTWMKSQAKALGSRVCGSQIVKADNAFFNRFIWCDPSGETSWYDKRHLFRMAGEHEHYAAGQRRLMVPLEDGVLLPQVCYDLRFPVWSRRQADYDVLLYVANWPAARRDHWLTLLKARAIENLCYVIGVNRIGVDGNGVSYSGDSTVIDYRGETLLSMGGEAGIGHATLDMTQLNHYREEFPADLDADDFNLLT